MIYPVVIGGEVVELEWKQDIARRYVFRASKIGGGPTSAEFSNPKKAAAAVASFLWLVLPPAVHARYATPEDLFVDIDHASQGQAIRDALVGIFADMAPDAEKKSTGKKTPLRKSNSD